VISFFLTKLVAVDFNGLSLFDWNDKISFVKHCQKGKDYRDTSKFKAESNQQISQLDLLCTPYFYSGLRPFNQAVLQPAVREYAFNPRSPVALYFEKYAPPPKV